MQQSVLNYKLNKHTNDTNKHTDAFAVDTTTGIEQKWQMSAA